MSDRLQVWSTFSGVGGIDRGLELAGMQVVLQAEGQYENVPEENLTGKERAGRSYGRWCREVLAHHYPDAEQYADVRDVAAARHGNEPARSRGRSQTRARHDGEPSGGKRRIKSQLPIDLLCGGFPCQDLSVAGKRAGLAGERSGLFHEFARIAGAVRPRWLLIENVPGLLSSNGGRDFGVVLHTLAELGYGVAWRTLDSRYFGVPQRRRRVFIVGRLGGDHRSALHALCEGCDGSPTASLCSWQEAATGTRGGTHGGVVVNALDTQRGGVDDNDAQGGRLVAIQAPALSVPSIAGTLMRSGQGSADPEMETLLPVFHCSECAGPGRHQELCSMYEPTLGFHMTQDPIYGDEFTPALGVTSSGMGVNQGGVRRLTPRECERLQGFPDDWTLIDGIKCPDSRRYAAMGNAVTVNVAEWIGRRIVAVDARTPETLLEAAAIARERNAS